jgi:hypothetical protein
MLAESVPILRSEINAIDPMRFERHLARLASGGSKLITRSIWKPAFFQQLPEEVNQNQTKDLTVALHSRSDCGRRSNHRKH